MQRRFWQFLAISLHLFGEEFCGCQLTKRLLLAIQIHQDL